jgi:NADP-dependent 3-hydroxy acid dehydrogenase YdfG
LFLFQDVLVQQSQASYICPFSKPRRYDANGYAVYCLDRLQKPDETFDSTKDKLAQQYEGSLHYRRVDVQDATDLDNVIAEIAAKHSRMDGLIAAAGVQNVQPALEYPPEKISEVS